MPEFQIARGRTSWPFQAAPTHHDSQVSPEGVGVPPRQEVQFKDGNCIWLIRVMKAGMPDLFVRELGDPARGALIDLRDFIPDCAKEMPLPSTRDVVGFVKFSLRERFATRDEFVQAVVAKAPRS